MRSSSDICRGRQKMVRSVILLAWAVLVMRLFHVQLLSRESFATQALLQQVSQQRIRARPGDILDRQGRLLATTLSVPSLFINPSRVDDPTTTAQILGEILQLNPDVLSSRIIKQKSKQFLWVKRLLSTAEFERLQTISLNTEEFGFREEFQRFYPQGTLAAHVLGLRNIDGIGQGGIEESFDSMLRGKDGTRRFVRDALGKTLEILEEVTEAPQHGLSLVLTLDAVIQLHTEMALDELVQQHHPLGACAIVLDPRSGDVLAMSSRPTFDPNSPVTAQGTAWSNHAISSSYEPGSTFKPLVVAWGLQQGLIQQEETFQCEWGEYRMGRRILHDHHPYGELSLCDVLVKSSNIGMAKIGERLGNSTLFEMATTFGFGRRTGLELPGEATGQLRPFEEWNSYSTGSIPMGHELAVTPIQMISAHAVLANHGKRLSPHLLLRTLESETAPRQVVVSKLLDESIARWVVEEPMVEVVKRGTGTQAQIDGVPVFGKTGTAEKVDPAGGYSTDKNFCSFLCGAPANDPRVLVLVCVDEPHGASQFGGSVAAPCASRILQDALTQVSESPSSRGE